MFLLERLFRRKLNSVVPQFSYTLAQLFSYSTEALRGILKPLGHDSHFLYTQAAYMFSIDILYHACGYVFVTKSEGNLFVDTSVSTTMR